MIIYIHVNCEGGVYFKTNSFHGHSFDVTTTLKLPGFLYRGNLGIAVAIPREPTVRPVGNVQR